MNKYVGTYIKALQKSAMTIPFDTKGMMIGAGAGGLLGAATGIINPKKDKMGKPMRALTAVRNALDIIPMSSMAGGFIVGGSTKSAGILDDATQSVNQIGHAAVNSPIGQGIQSGINSIKNSPLGHSVTNVTNGIGFRLGSPSWDNFKRNSGYNLVNQKIQNGIDSVKNSPLGQSVAQVGVAAQGSPLGQRIGNEIGSRFSAPSLDNFKRNSGYNRVMNSLNSIGHRINDQSPIEYRPTATSTPSITHDMAPLNSGESRISL